MNKSDVSSETLPWILVVLSLFANAAAVSFFETVKNQRFDS